jgi:1,4-dihydroxy-2-naphthoyl-CoA hydrolase
MTKRTPRTTSTEAPDDPPLSHIKLPGVTRALSIVLTSSSRECVTGEMHIGDHHLNRSGKVNGGAIMAFGDVLGARGTVENLPPGYRTTTIESKTNFFAGGVGPVVTAESIPLHIGRTTMVWQTTVRNPDGRRVAIVTQTQIVIPGEPAGRKTPRPAKKSAARKPARTLK